jgi:hypothetical protein
MNRIKILAWPYCSPTKPPPNLKASALSDRQRAMLLAWKRSRSAWTTRILHGADPSPIIEFSSQGVGGDSTMHVHTMYRDPTNDYDIKLTGAQ